MIDHFILVGKEVVPCDLMTWAKWFEDRNNDRHVADERIGEVRVSTVFLGLDHSFGDGPPLLFETLVFNGPLDDEIDRYTTYDEAVAGHAAMVDRVKEATK